MTLALRPYQEDSVANVRRALKVHRRVLLQSPVGSGKTILAGTMIRGCVEAGWTVWFLCHRTELIDQTSRTLNGLRIDHGYVAAGYPTNYSKQVLVCSVQTIGRRLARLNAPKIIFVDESHHAVAGTWRAIINAFPSALIVGLTATPERLDGKGLGDMFNALIPGPSVRWLMDEGYLSDFLVWTHDTPDLSAMKMRGADFDPEALTKAMSDPHLLGDAVEHYQRLCPGERGVSFCVSIEHALKMRDAFRAAGVNAEELDGGAPKDIRRSVIRAFRAGDIDVLTSVDLFGEGFDLPEMAVAILQRPTKSLGLTIQQCGRVLRPVYHPDADLSTREGRLWGIANGMKPMAKILDHAGNLKPIDKGGHGPPDLERQWSLAGRTKKSRDGGTAGARICPQCFGASPAGTPICAACGHVFVPTPREVEQLEGQLREMEREQVRVALASEPIRKAATFAAVIEIFKARGNKEPVTAADNVMRSRGQAPTEAEFLAALEAYARERGYKHGWVSFRVRLRRTRVMRQGEKVA